MEQVRLQEDLSVGNRDDVRRDIRRQIAGLRLDDRQRGQRAAAQLLVQFGRALQQARVQVEDVARIRLAARRAPQQQRDLAVRLGVFRQIVVDHERMATAVAEVLAEGACGIGRDVEQRRRIGCRCRDDDRVPHRVGFFERAHHLRDRRLLLADRVVDADDASVLLVEDRVDRHGGLPGLAISDDQLALSAADRHHRVDGLQSRLDRLLHRLPVDDSGGQTLDRRRLRRADRPFAVNRLPERVHHASEQLVADRDGNDAAGPLDQVAFLDLLELAEQHRADALLFEVQCDAEHAVRELEHLPGHRVVHSMHPRDAVADRDDAADLGDVDVDGEAPDLFTDDLGNLFSLDVHSVPLRQPFLHALQLPRDAAVVHRAADAGDNAPDDRRVDFRRHRDGSSGDLRQAALDRLHAPRVDCARRRHFGTDNAPIIEQAVAVGGEQVRQQDEAVAVGQERKELRQDRRKPRPREQLADGCTLARHGHGGIEEHLRQGWILPEEIHELRQLVLDLLEVRLLLEGDVEEGARVADGGGLVRHGRCPTPELAKSFTSSPDLYHSWTRGTS